MHPASRICLRGAQCIRFCLHAFLYPEEKNLSILKSPDFQEHVKDLMHCYEGIEDGAEFKKCLEEVCSLFTATAIETLQRDYRSIVGHTMSKECPLYETQFGVAQVFQQVHELGDIQGFYKAFGVDTSDVERERCDHVSVEMEFMHFLLYKQAYALENHGDEKAQICVDAQKKFLKEHIGKWVPLFAVLFGRKAGDGFYVALSASTKRIHAIGNAINGILRRMYIRNPILIKRL